MFFYVLDTSDTLFIYKLNNNGPNTDPWGTPQVIFINYGFEIQHIVVDYVAI